MMRTTIEIDADLHERLQSHLEEGETVEEFIEELLSMYDIDSMVTVVKREDPFTEEVFKLWQVVVERATAEGVDQWAVVAEGVEDISVDAKVSVNNVETYTTEDRAEAVQWSQS